MTTPRTDPRMSPLERFDLEQQAGYPFPSNEKAQDYRRRMVFCSLIDKMLERTSPNPERRRVGRNADVEVSTVKDSWGDAR